MDRFKYVWTFYGIINLVTAFFALSPSDSASYSRPEFSIINHISLSLSVNFNEKILYGSAVLYFDVLKDSNKIILDVQNQTIEHISLENEETGSTLLQYVVTDPVPDLGSKLTITLPNTVERGNKLKLIIKYNTSPKASALLWLDPNLTSGKKHPYVFSQCGPVHARSLVPCQDTPAVKFTYDAEITAPEGFTVLMSALRDAKGQNKTVFRQPIPIPAYLFALAVGVLEYRRIGPRSLVWSEKEEIEASAWEFGDVEKYIEAAEKFCGPYQWTQYDLLVLPPPFPYGGMENPGLTFVTPALLAGDRSLASVIVHEIAHSWTGNLVTHKNFEHFWLKEGFTVFLERKIIGFLESNTTIGKRKRDFESLLGLQSLRETVDQLGPSNPLTCLVPNLTETHPDQAYSIIPYEKGSLFVRFLEDIVGGPEIFDQFLPAFINHFSRKSIDTTEFKEYFMEYFQGNDKLKLIDWEVWLYSSGLPPVIPEYDKYLTTAVSELVEKVNKEISNGSLEPKLSFEDVESFSPNQIMYFLQELIDGPTLPLNFLRSIGQVYQIESSRNVEILYRWLRLCARSRDEEKITEIFEFLNHQGRMKYVRPIYRELYNWKDVRERAIENFLQNESNMMKVTAFNLRIDLHLS